MTSHGRAEWVLEEGWNLLFRCPNCTLDLKVHFSKRQLFAMLLKALKPSIRIVEVPR